ncbi:putative mitochondrial inner membrane protein 1 [Hyaloscypha bicolor E]|uniref:Putative mitochondrial inner membrane protein 1 n=1 Tax=Hyaloscypha bicolor E TaxID=1095630 RepID=A0A2J6SSB1_9HELO|nr:putative mitochondrial inner membrane protein 1 [Hyaloscypha bicolor E]PMD53671.1 putative mitochondrial inner membrane protein 1 [Hyaloscypha bicolor E]
MLRSTATRSLLKSFTKAPTARSSFSAASIQFRNASPLRQVNNNRPQVRIAIPRLTTTSLLYATTKAGPPFDKIDEKAEQKLAKKPLEAHPDEVSGGSSVRHVFEKGQGEGVKGDEMTGAIKADLRTIRETFSLADVPKESLYIGAAGILPYAATSLSTVFLAYDINHAHDTGRGILFSPETAHQLLDLITPIQIGYGAVIISFLGAIHWGLEYAGYGGYHSYRRYIYGVIAPAVAWPTIFMPVEYALITQFLAFNFLYFADARATVRGWFPEWYSVYRFVLTFFVGASIVISLIGRGQIVKADHTLRNPVDYVKKDRDSQWEAFEREEKERRAQMVKEDEDGEKSEDDSEESKDDGDDQKDDKKEDKEAEKKDKKEKK